MADTKFSALPPAGTLTGAEIACIAQGGISSKVLLNLLGVPVIGYDGTNTMFDLSATASTRIRIKANQAATTLDGFLQSGNQMPIFLSSNLYWDGTNWRYNATGPASLMSLYVSGSWLTYTFPSGTAGAIATLIGALLFSNAGGLSIGTTTDAGTGNLLATGLISCAGFDLSATAATRLRIKSNQTTVTPDMFIQGTGGALILGRNVYYDGTNYRYVADGVGTALILAGISNTMTVFSFASGLAGNIATQTTCFNVTSAGGVSCPSLTTTAGITAGGGLTGDTVSLVVSDAVANSISIAAWLAHNTTGTPAVGLGTAMEFRAETTGTGGADNIMMGRMYWQWSDPNHPTRNSYLTLTNVKNTVNTGCAYFHASGGVSTAGSSVDPGSGYMNVGTGYKINNVSIGTGNVKVSVYGSTVTHTTVAGCSTLIVELCGGGGGGGGASATANCSCAGGGGAGGYAFAYTNSPAASYLATVGAGGTAGAATGTNGGTGGTTTFAGICQATGGAGGGGDASSGAAGCVQGGIGGVGALGAFMTAGGDGGIGMRLGSNVGASGFGGNSVWGGSARGAIAQSVGGAGNNYGGGGSGAKSSSAGQLGGAGAGGVIKVIEYY